MCDCGKFGVSRTATSRGDTHKRYSGDMVPNTTHHFRHIRSLLRSLRFAHLEKASGPACSPRTSSAVAVDYLCCHVFSGCTKQPTQTTTSEGAEVTHSATVRHGLAAR